MADDTGNEKDAAPAEGLAQIPRFARLAMGWTGRIAVDGAGSLRRGLVRAAMASGAMDPNKALDEEGGLNRLQVALVKGDAKMASTLIEAGADPLRPNKSGRAAMEVAIVWGRVDALALMLEAGWDPNAVNADPQSAHPRMAGALVGLCRSARMEQGGLKCLATARILLAAGADVDRGDAEGLAPLHEASTYHRNSVALAKLLISCGADVDARDGLGRSPLMCAVQVSNYAAALALIEAGADVDAKDGMGRSPLMAACAGQVHLSPKGMDPCVRLLLDCGADVLLKDACGRDCVEHAKARLRFELADHMQALILAKKERASLGEAVESGREDRAKPLRM